MRLQFDVATDEDVPTLVALRNAAAEELTRRYGHGHWSSASTPRGVLFGMKGSRVLLARRGSRIAGTLRLATKKPWAIDTAYFTSTPRPLYLLDMVVDPAVQRSGVGKALLAEAERVAREWPAGAIRLDAYDAPAGAGAFYARCGYRETGRVTYRGTPLIYFERVLEAAGAARAK